MAQHSDFDRAWHKFKRGDAMVTARPRVRHAVMAAWDAAKRDRVEPRAARAPWPVVGAAAAAVVAIAVTVALGDREPSDEGTGTVDAVHAETTDTREVRRLRLTTEPSFEGEPLAVMRLRMPSASLAAFGISVAEPDESLLVDVDVVVGSDGLARSIRGIRFTAEDSVVR